MAIRKKFASPEKGSPAPKRFNSGSGFATLKTVLDEGRHIVTLDPDLGVEFEMGSSKATLRCSSAPCATRVAYLRRRAARILTGHRD